MKRINFFFRQKKSNVQTYIIPARARCLHLMARLQTARIRLKIFSLMDAIIKIFNRFATLIQMV